MSPLKSPSLGASPVWRGLLLVVLLTLSACTTLNRWALTLSGVGEGTLACQRASQTNPMAALVPGTGGTGRVAGLPGTGGTGGPASPGTGGTGIVGVVTGFASICVNGVEVDYGSDVPVERNGAQSSIGTLAVGQWVALQAQGQGDQLRAQRIVVLETVEGPLTAIDMASGRFAVMGDQAVALRRGDLVSLTVGGWVRVSGQRLPSGEIRASRVESVQAGVAMVTGPYADLGSGAWRVGGVRVSLAPGVPRPVVAQGQEVGVSGRWVTGQLLASEMRVQPTREAIGNVDEVLLQGYVQALDGNALQLGYEKVTLSDLLTGEGRRGVELKAGQLVRARGQMDAQQRVTVDRIEIWREAIRGDGSSQRRAQTGDSDGGDKEGESDSRSKDSSRRGDRGESDHDHHESGGDHD